MSVITITVPNWDKYNLRSDRKSSSWFRFQNEFFSDHKIFALTEIQKLLYVFILCEVSRKNRATTEIHLGYLNSFFPSQTIDNIEKNIHVLSGFGLVEFQDGSERKPKRKSRHTSAIPPGVDHHTSALPGGIATYVRTDIRTDTCEKLKNSDSGGCVEELPAEKLEAFFVERQVSLKTQRAWLNAYPDPSWVASEIFKAIAWESADPSRRKKLFSRFMTGWLSRGWEKRKTEESKPTWKAPEMSLENNPYLITEADFGLGT